MKRLETELADIVLLEPVIHGDERGFFVETYRREQLAAVGIEHDFVQHNFSRSRRGVLRGMHFQPGQAKFIRCLQGKVLDILVDIRPGSPTLGRWEGFELSDVNGHAVYCPDGFAHGFCVLSEVADVFYLCSAYYDPGLESGFRYDDPDVAIAWPEEIELRISERDRSAPRLAELGGLRVS
jgi:dTDP-4-dehydrorhamnose 3,5-epimerase